MENDMRGLLRNFGLKVGTIRAFKFDERIRELVEAAPDLAEIIEPLLTARQKLREEFASRVPRKQTALQDIRELLEQKLRQMLQHNPLRMDYYKKYQEIIADYNREKDRATVEETFARLLDLANTLDAEERRAAEEGLSEDELALFDLLYKDSISKAMIS